MVKRVFTTAYGRRSNSGDAKRHREQCCSALLAFEKLDTELFLAPVWETFGLDGRKDELAFELARYLLSAPVRNELLSLVKTVIQNTPGDDWEWEELIDPF